MGTQEILLFTIIVIFLFLNYFTRKGKKDMENQKNSGIDKNLNTPSKINIPETCPQCKSPNTNKLRLCEWCGNQII